MRALVGICLLAAGALVPGPAAAQETEALRKELEQVRRQFETMKEGYEKAINQLSDRLKTLESRPATPAATPAAAAPGTAVPAVAGPGQMLSQAQPGIPITPMELARPREPFSLYERRGAGQLLFDMGIAGDFVANFTQRNVDKANAGTFSGRENRFFPREVELSLFGQIDPFARGEVIIETGEEPNETGELTLRLAEAHLTLLTLPFNTQLKMGQMRNRFGLLNQLHAHDRPFIDSPNVLTRFLGEEGLVERGAELTWVAPLPFFLEGLVGVFNGDNEDAFGRGKLSEPLVTGRAPHLLRAGRFRRHPARRVGGQRRDAGAAPQYPVRLRRQVQVGTARLAAAAAHGARRADLPGAAAQRARGGYGRRRCAGHARRDAPPQPLGLVRGRGGAALPHRLAEGPGRRLPLRLDAVPGHARARVGGGPLHLVPAVGIPALPPGLQAHAADGATGPISARTNRAPGRWTRSSSRPRSSWAPIRRIRSSSKRRP